jgi:hypothetical protein
LVSRLTRIEPDRQIRIGGSGRSGYRVLAEAVVL